MLNDLPNDVLDVILGHLNARSIARVQCVSTTLRDAGKRAALQVHATPKNAHAVLCWAAARAPRVTRVSLRRLKESWHLFDTIALFENALSVNALFCRIMLSEYHVFPQRLRRLTLDKITKVYGESPEFKTSRLPPHLERVSLTFDSTWSTVVVDRGVPTLEIKGAPDIHIDTLDTITHLTLTTLQLILVHPHASSQCIRYARIEADGMLGADNVLRAIGPVPDVVVLSMPMASAKWSDFPWINSRVLALDLDFLCFDRVSPQLETLEIRVDRLATAPVPESVDVWAEVRGVEVDRSFFG